MKNSDDCWAHAFARALSAVMKQRGTFENIPTTELLIKKIERKYLTKTNALIKSIEAAPSKRRIYGCDLVVQSSSKAEIA